jgi:hypothetical protein
MEYEQEEGRKANKKAGKNIFGDIESLCNDLLQG